MRLPPRQQRLIQCLLKRPHSRYELGDLTGSLNVCDVVFRLRNMGLNIITDRKPMTDRDGQTVRPGYYRLPEEEKEKARKLLGSAATPPNDLKHSTYQEKPTCQM